MAARGAGLNVVITGDTKGLERATRSANTHLDKLGKQTSMTARVTSKGFSGIGLAARGMTAAVGGAAIGIGFLTKQYVESNKVAKQTDAVLKSTGSSAGVTAKQVGDLATAISRKTGIDDEAIQSGENLLLTFTNIRNEAGKGNKIFNQSTRLLADMSVALGQDTKSSAIQLGKALNDPIKGVTALQRVGVSFTVAQKAQIKALVDSGHAMQAQKLILRELNKEFGGSAAAQATPFDKLKVSAGNLAETLGGYLAPALGKAAAFTNRFLIQLQDGTGAGGKFIRWVKGAAETLTGAWRSAVNAVHRFTERNKDDIQSVSKAMRNVGIAVKAVVENVLIPVVKRLFPIFKGVFEGIITVARGLIRFVSGVLTGNWKKAWQGIKDIVKGAVKAIIAVWGGIGKALLDAAVAGGKAIGKGILKGLGNLGHLLLQKVKDSLDFVADSLNNPGGIPGAIGKAIGKGVTRKLGLDGDGLGKIGGGDFPAGGSSGSLMGAQPALAPFAAAGSRFGLHVSSGRRPGSITSSGNTSFHSSGEAIDMADGRGPDANKLRYFNYLKTTMGSRLAELIYTPGGMGIKNGRPFRYTGSVAADHYDHVHVALDTGRPGVGDGLGRTDRRIITNAAKAGGISPAVLYGVWGAESHFSHGPGPTSPAGARGPFQFMPDTARSLGVNASNFRSAAYGAARYLGRYKSRGVAGMLAAYNAGPGGNPNNPETRAYIPRVLSISRQWKGAGSASTGGGGRASIIVGQVTGPLTGGASVSGGSAGSGVYSLPGAMRTASGGSGSGDDGGDPNQPLIDAINAAAELQQRLADQRSAAEAEIASNQKLLLKLAGQGDQILAAVIAAVNGGIGGRVGLGSQTPSYAGGVARY